MKKLTKESSATASKSEGSKKTRVSLSVYLSVCHSRKEVGNSLAVLGDILIYTVVGNISRLYGGEFSSSSFVVSLTNPLWI